MDDQYRELPELKEEKLKSHTTAQRTRYESGTTVVEFAIIAVFLFTFIFGTIEVARMMFLWNTITEVTARAARAAAMANFNNASALDQLRIDALAIAAKDDKLIFAPEITHDNVVIDYVQRDGRTPVTMPPCPAMNVVNCMANPNGSNCIHFVRARLCKKDSNCDNVPYVPLVPLPGIDKLNMPMPWFSAVVPVETLGMPGACT